jgi:hypothetical protein
MIVDDDEQNVERKNECDRMSIESKLAATRDC